MNSSSTRADSTLSCSSTNEKIFEITKVPKKTALMFKAIPSFEEVLNYNPDKFTQENTNNLPLITKNFFEDADERKKLHSSVKIKSYLFK